MSGEVVVTRDEGIVTLTLSNPKRRNALSLEMYDALQTQCQAVDVDRSVRALVLRGAGGAFAGGTDITHFADFRDGQDGVEYEAQIGEVLGTLRDIRVPVISVVEGACVGGGLVLAALSDLVLCTPAARFGSPIAFTLGNTIAPTSIARLWWTLGRRLTSELLITGRLLDADEAHRAGFVTEVLELARLEERLEAILAKIRSGASLSLESFKEFGRRIDAAHAGIQVDDVYDRVYGSSDFEEGVAAFLARRLPVYTDH